MQLFSLRKSDVPLRNGKLSAECSEPPPPPPPHTHAILSIVLILSAFYIQENKLTSNKLIL